MSTAKTKKTMRRRQKGPLQRRNARRDATSHTRSQRSRSTSDAAITSSIDRPSPGSTSRRLSAPATLVRSPNSPDPASQRSDARRARADARASRTPAASPQVRQPSFKRQTASRDLNRPPAKPISTTGTSKQDFATGRTLFPVESDGKLQYLPIASEATPQEQRLGLFVANDAVQQAAVNKRVDPATVKPASLQDFATDRTLFATERADGKREYLPKESEATALELSQGKYVPDDQVEVPSRGNTVLNKSPRFDFNEQRTVFATQAANGQLEYLPKKSEATALELSQGRYVNDAEISSKAPLGAIHAMSNLKPRYDLGKGRQVYAVKTDDGKTLYLPRESEADGLERMRGQFIPDDIVDRHERQRHRTALRDNDAAQAQRRAQRATRLPSGVTRSDRDSPPEPVHQSTDGTPLWDGFTPPPVSMAKQRQTLIKLHPRYDLGKDRLVYPTETARGKIEYLPLLADATPSERVRGLYAAFVPPEPLSAFLTDAETQNQLVRQSFTTDRGTVRAYAQNDIDTLFEQAPTLVLRSAQLVSESARQTPELQQQFNHHATDSQKNQP